MSCQPHILRQFYKLGYLEKGRDQQEKGWGKKSIESSKKLEIPDSKQNALVYVMDCTHSFVCPVYNLALTFQDIFLSFNDPQ